MLLSSLLTKYGERGRKVLLKIIKWRPLPSWTAWKGLFASTSFMECVIFSLCKMSSLRLRSEIASWKTSSSLTAFSSNMAPVEKMQLSTLQYVQRCIAKTRSVLIMPNLLQNVSSFYYFFLRTKRGGTFFKCVLADRNQLKGEYTTTYSTGL